MKQTSNYGLKKPEGQDVVNIDDLNYNADILDTQLKSLNNNLDNQIKNINGSKVDKVQGKQLSTEDYSTVEKQKLAGIAQGANNYIHPNDSNTRHVTDAEKQTWNSKANSSHNHDDRYYTETEINNALSSKANSVHAHDDKYYTKTEVNNSLGGKANNGHTHDDRYYTESEADSRFAAKSHTHSIAQITDFKDSTADLNNRISALEGKISAMQNSIWIA